MREAGQPVDDATLDQLYRRQTSDEFTGRWLDLLDLVEGKLDAKRRSELRQWMASGNSVDDDLPGLGEAVEWISAFDSILVSASELAEQQLIADSAPVYWPIEFQSLNTDFSFVQRIGALASIIDFQHLVAHQTDNPTIEVQCIRSMQGLQKSLRRVPVSSAFLLRYVVHSRCQRMIQVSLASDRLDSEQLIGLGQALDEFDTLQVDVRYVYRGERALAIPAFEDVTLAAKLGRGGSWSSRLRGVDAWNYLQLAGNAIDIEVDDERAYEQALARIEQVIRNEQESLTSLEPLDHGMTDKLFGSYTEIGLMMTRWARELHLTRAAIALRLTSARHGAWPKKLDELDESIVSEVFSLASPDLTSLQYEVGADGSVELSNASHNESVGPMEPKSSTVWRLEP